ncbi:MAG: hypothetical protein ACRD1V_05960 [Vicinamibacterales bacterium]
MNEDSLIFVMTPPGLPEHERLVIRCDAEGQIWISIETDRVIRW